MATVKGSSRERDAYFGQLDKGPLCIKSDQLMQAVVVPAQGKPYPENPPGYPSSHVDNEVADLGLNSSIPVTP